MDRPRDRHLRILGIAAGLVILAGLLLRIREYAANPAPPIDEELSAIDVLVRPMLGLWQPLDLGQGGAPLYLSAVKLLTLVAGPSPLVLRAISFVAGCLTLPMLWWLGTRVLALDAALLAVVLVAFAPVHLFYDNFFRAYASSALLCVLLLDRAAVFVRRPSWRALPMLGVLGLVSILLSVTSIFVLAGVVACLLVVAARLRSRLLLRGTLTLGASWVGLSVLLQNTMYAPLNDVSVPVGRYMHYFWRSYFVFHGPDRLRSVFLASSSFLENAFFSMPFADEVGITTLVLGVLLVAGLISLARRDRAIGLLFAVPLGTLFVVSAFQRYPMGVRVLLFVTPLVAIGIAEGFTLLLRRLATQTRLAFALIVATLACAGGARFLAHPIDPHLGYTSDALFPAWYRAERPGDALYVRPFTMIGWLYLNTDWRAPDTAATMKLIRLVDLDGPSPFPEVMQELVPLPAATNAQMRVRWAGRTLLVGRPSGLVGNDRKEPLDGWGAGEAARIKAASPCTDVVLGYPEQESHVLAERLRDLGGDISESRHSDRDATWRVCFPVTVATTR